MTGTRIALWTFAAGVAIVGIAAIGGASKRSAEIASPWPSRCAAAEPAMDRVLASWRDAGVVVDTRFAPGEAEVRVEDRRWAGAPHDGKVSIAVAAYCLVVAADGSGAARIVAYRSEARLARIVDGNYFD